MQTLSVFDAYHIEEEPVLRHGFNSAPHYHPLKFVKAVTERPTDYLVLIGHDFLDGRVIKGERVDNFADHTTFALVGPGIHLSFTWGAKCLVDRHDGQKFVPRYPELASQAALYDGLKKWPMCLKVFHISPWLWVAGTGNREPRRHFDNVMSRCITKKQFDTMRSAVESFEKKHAKYQALAIIAPNCHRFAASILRSGGVKMPVWWGWLPWPAIDAHMLDWRADKQKRFDCGWQLQSRNMTAHMQEELKLAPQAPRSSARFGVEQVCGDPMPVPA